MLSAVLFRKADAELGRGTPSTLPAATRAGLALADRAFARGDIEAAVDAVRAVARRLFARQLHFDRMTSPLADDASAFLAHWHRSTTVRALAAPRGRSSPSVAPTPDRPLRVLMTAQGNYSFLRPIHRHCEQLPGVEVRLLTPDGDDPHTALLTDVRSMITHILAGDSAYGDKVRQWLAPHVEWADVVFVDWCVASAVLFTMIDPGSTRVIVRLHSFETFALWPHLVDFSRVDDVVFVSDFLRDLTVSVVPALANGPRTHVISNAMELGAFARDKRPQARFTLGLIGIKAVAKDARWAVRVLRILREHDERYRLVLLGDEPDTGVNDDVRRYWNGLLRDITDLESAGAVIRMGHVADVPGALEEIGVILSTSVRESFHCALVEGAASGAVPVVRDWPFFAGRPASARTLFPSDWVVDTPEEAAARIIATTSTEPDWLAAGRAASRTAVTTWDYQSQVSHQFERLLLGAARPDSACATPSRDPHRVIPHEED